MLIDTVHETRRLSWDRDDDIFNTKSSSSSFSALRQHRDARREAREVGVLGRHVGRRLGRELVELVGRDAVVDALDDLLGQDLRRAYCDENALAWSCDHDRLVATPSRRPRHKFKFISRSDVARSA